MLVSIENPILRWKIGHRLFFFLTQALIVTHHDIRTALASGNIPKAQEAMELAIVLFDSSMTAFDFSSGYSQEDYRDIVRPSVSPPHFDSLLSGTQYIDHIDMLKQIKSCRELFMNLPEALSPTYERYIQSIQKLYCNHSKVCSRIVGDHHSEPAKIREQYMTRTLKYAGVENPKAECDGV